MQVVCGVRNSVNVAYQAAEHKIPESVQSVYNKLNGLEPKVSAEEVRVADRNFWVKGFLSGVERQNAFFVVRKHEQLPWKLLESSRKHRGGPKKARSKPKYDSKRPHVSIAKLIAARSVPWGAPLKGWCIPS